MRAKTKGKHEMGKRSAILMKRRTRIAGATLAVAAGLTTAVAAPANSAPQSAQGVSPRITLLSKGQLDPLVPCQLQYAAAWKPVNGQIAVDFSLMDLTLNNGSTVLGPTAIDPDTSNATSGVDTNGFLPLAQGKHKIELTVHVYGPSEPGSGSVFTTLLTGSTTKSLPCSRGI